MNEDAGILKLVVEILNGTLGTDVEVLVTTKDGLAICEHNLFSYYFIST